MEKIKTFFASLDYNLILISLVVLRSVIFGPLIADALILVPLLGLHIAKKWFNQLTYKSVTDELVRDVQEMKAKFAGNSILNSQKKPQNLKNFWG